jgi:hypothetical protein
MLERRFELHACSYFGKVRHFFACPLPCSSHTFGVGKSGMSLKPEPESPDAIAETRIQTALREQTSKLELSGLGITSLPESLGKLPALQTLDLSRNRLVNLPESIGKLASLEILYLCGKSAYEPPRVPRASHHAAKTLPSLNQLTSLPKSLGRLSSLRMLDLPAISSRACGSESLRCVRFRNFFSMKIWHRAFRRSRIHDT